MTREDVKSVFDEALKNCLDNGFIADVDDMTADELTCELLDGNDCFAEEDRDMLLEIVREWQEAKAGFNVGNRTSDSTLHREANRPQACAYAKASIATNQLCPVCRARPGEPCHKSEQAKERDRKWDAAIRARKEG